MKFLTIKRLARAYILKLFFNLTNNCWSLSWQSKNYDLTAFFDSASIKTFKFLDENKVYELNYCSSWSIQIVKHLEYDKSWT